MKGSKNLRWRWVIEVHLPRDLHPITKKRQLTPVQLVALPTELNHACDARRHINK
jgi:hypothetical protein